MGRWWVITTCLFASGLQLVFCAQEELRTEPSSSVWFFFGASHILYVVLLAMASGLVIFLCGICGDSSDSAHPRPVEPDIEAGSRSPKGKQNGNTPNGRPPEAPHHSLAEIILENKLQLNFNELELIKPPVGEGAMGVVHKANYRGKVVAVKTFNSDVEGTELDREIGLLAALGLHPNIVLLIGASLTPPCLVTEFLEHGSLSDVYHKTPELLTAARAEQILRDVAAGMQFLHSQSPPILQRDLKGANILITDDWRAKITDFGISRPESSGTMTVLVGTGRWMAPEIHSGAMNYTAKADVYSYAMVMWEAFAKKTPYPELKFDVKVAQHVLTGGRPPVEDMGPDVPPYIVALMLRCWAKQPDARPSFQECLSEFDKYLPQ